MKKTKFESCNLLEVDFSEADISEAVLNDCDLNGAIFDNTILTKTNLSSAKNFTINPLNNQLKGAIINRDFVDGITQHFGLKLT